MRFRPHTSANIDYDQSKLHDTVLHVLTLLYTLMPPAGYACKSEKKSHSETPMNTHNSFGEYSAVHSISHKARLRKKCELHCR